MYIDNFKTVVLEQCTWPGSIGDSMAETARLSILLDFLGLPNDLGLSAFITPTGYVRHPTAPEHDEKGESWRETDMVSDQCLPWFVAEGAMRKDEMRERIKANGWRTGNGDPVSPIFWAELKGYTWLRVIFLLIQLLLFNLAFRWSDANNAFEETSDSSCDYLNFIIVSLYAPKWFRKLCPEETLKQKVRSYYATEPSHFVVSLYEQVLLTYF
jgi:hypothetical protein